MRFSLRPGFTLVELIVAVLLIDVGLLALVAGSAVVVKRQNELRMRAAATRAAANRLEILAASPCSNAVGSAQVDRDIVESWTATVRTDGFRELADSVSYTFGGLERRVMLRTRALC